MKPPSQQDARDGVLADDAGWCDPRLVYQLERARADEGDDFDVLPLALTLLLHRATSTLVKASQFDLEPMQLTTTQFNVLTVLHRAEEPLTMRALAETVSVRPPNLTTVVDGLVSRRLITKTVSSSDRRSHLVTTTPQGEAMMSRFMPSHWRFMTEFYAGLDRDEQVILGRLLDKLLVSLEPGAEAEFGLPKRIVDAALSFS